MPRKPSSIFLLVEQADQVTGRRIRIDDDTNIEMIVQQEFMGQQPQGRVWVVEDTKAIAYHTTLKVEEVDDPRLQEPPAP